MFVLSPLRLPSVCLHNQHWKLERLGRPHLLDLEYGPTYQLPNWQTRRGSKLVEPGILPLMLSLRLAFALTPILG